MQNMGANNARFAPIRKFLHSGGNSPKIIRFRHLPASPFSPPRTDSVNVTGINEIGFCLYRWSKCQIIRSTSTSGQSLGNSRGSWQRAAGERQSPAGRWQSQRGLGKAPGQTIGRSAQSCFDHPRKIFPQQSGRHRRPNSRTDQATAPQLRLLSVGMHAIRPFSHLFD